MKNFSRRFLVLMAGGVGLWLLANVAAFAQEEKHYRHADGYEFSDWGQGPRENQVGLEAKNLYLSAKLLFGATEGEQTVTWKSYLDGDEEV